MDIYIFGNWKMNGTPASARSLAGALASVFLPAGTHVAVFPPFTLLHDAGEALKGSRIAHGAQDCSASAKDGAFTGEVSATMLKDAGCRYVITGHSERRQQHGESSDLVKRKASNALEAGLIPVICVGETEGERKAGRHLEAVSAQVRASLPQLTHSAAFTIAYEPVWAIGSGATPTLAQIEEMHKTIASLLTYDTSGARTAILYGGSVKASNAAEILSAASVNGVLVGGASLKTEEFAAIIAAAGHR